MQEKWSDPYKRLFELLGFLELNHKRAVESEEQKEANEDKLNRI